MTWTTIAAATLGVSVLLLSGCGGGDSGAPTAAAPTGGTGSATASVGASGSSGGFINWIGNSNGTVVKDAANGNLQFRAGDGAMYDGTSYYSNVVVSGSDLLLDGSRFGYVGPATSTTGSTIAALYCTNGTVMSVVRGTLSCPGASGGSSGGTNGGITGGASGGTAGGTSSGSAWGDANSCVSIFNAATGANCGSSISRSFSFRNTCSAPISVYFGLERTNGTWDTGRYTSLAPGASGSYFTCQGTGQLRYVGTFTVNAPNPSPFP